MWKSIFVEQFVICVYRDFLSVHCSLVVTCWERANLLALLCVMFYFAFVTFPCDGLGQVVSISDLCLLTYFNLSNSNFAGNMLASVPFDDLISTQS